MPMGRFCGPAICADLAASPSTTTRPLPNLTPRPGATLRGDLFVVIAWQGIDGGLGELQKGDAAFGAL